MSMVDRIFLTFLVFTSVTVESYHLSLVGLVFVRLVVWLCQYLAFMTDP